jgi:hypothetical protein
MLKFNAYSYLCDAPCSVNGASMQLPTMRLADMRHRTKLAIMMPGLHKQKLLACIASIFVPACKTSTAKDAKVKRTFDKLVGPSIAGQQLCEQWAACACRA